MAQCKAASLPSVGFYLESEIGRHEEVEAETNDVAHRVGCRLVDNG